MKYVCASYGQGKHCIQGNAFCTGEGIIVTLTGGDKPHVGAAVMSIPRPSLSSGGISCNTWVLPVLGHKDDELARLIAEPLAINFNQTVVVCAGIHIDAATAEDIETVKSNSLKVLDDLMHKCV